MDTIDDIAELEALYGATNPMALEKETPRLTPAYRAWIEQAPFFVLATIGPGGLDCSPRGDAAGEAVRVLDDATLAMPDRRGNNRLDSLRNIVADPRVALMFMTPSVNEAVRVNGRARLTADRALRASFAVSATQPATVAVIAIEAVYFQCARAMKRARLWDVAARGDPASVPTAGQMTRSASPDFDAERYDAALQARQAATLY